MAGSQKILTILVASPSDVAEERDRLEEIVDEVNYLHARRAGTRLEVLRWERDASPGLGEDAQDVINRQIPQDYEVFIGILWHRFGSPTGRAASGTLEEYRMAKARYEQDPSSVRLMLYFKDSPPVTMKAFDADQYKMVEEFRSAFEQEGLYKGFTSAEDFTNKIRVDLTRLIYDELTARQPDSKHATESEATGREGTSPDDAVGDDDISDEGLFELEEAYEEEMSSLNATLSRISGYIGDVGASVQGRGGDSKP